MKKLTDRQKETLNFIANFIKENNAAPTVREISDYLGCAPTGSLGHLVALELKHKIIRTSKPRDIRIIDKAFEVTPCKEDIFKIKRCIVCTSKRHIMEYYYEDKHIYFCVKHYGWLDIIKKAVEKQGLKLHLH
jgi:SOS-response transcriptional repressor LexA